MTTDLVLLAALPSPGKATGFLIALVLAIVLAIVVRELMRS